MPARLKQQLLLRAPSQIGQFWLKFVYEKTIGATRFPRPFRYANQEASLLEFMPYLAWEYAKLGYSTLKRGAREQKN